MSGLKKILLFFIALAVLFFLFLTWYQYTYSMDEAVAFKVNSPDLNRKLVIATQGSEFKEAVTNRIVNNYKSDSIFIEVIDISNLDKIDPDNYNAIALIHTWESWKPPETVQLFIDRTKQYQDKIIVLTTSGEGSSKMENVDAVTGESKKSNIEPLAEKMITRLNILLTSKTTLEQ